MVLMKQWLYIISVLIENYMNRTGSVELIVQGVYILAEILYFLALVIQFRVK